MSRQTLSQVPSPHLREVRGVLAFFTPQTKIFDLISSNVLRELFEGPGVPIFPFVEVSERTYDRVVSLFRPSYPVRWNVMRLCRFHMHVPRRAALCSRLDARSYSLWLVLLFGLPNQVMKRGEGQ